MKIDFKQKIKDLDGNVIKEPTKIENGVVLETIDLTLERVFINALLVTLDTEKNIDGNEKLSRFNIAQKIKKNEELVIEEIAKIKEMVGKTYNTMIVGRVYEILK